MLAATVWLNKLESETLFLSRSPNFFKESPHVHLMILQHSIIFNPCVNANSLNLLGCRYFKQPLCFAGGRKLPSNVHARWLLRTQRLPRQTASYFPPIFLCRNGLQEIGICRNQARSRHFFTGQLFCPFTSRTNCSQVPALRASKLLRDFFQLPHGRCY